MLEAIAKAFVEAGDDVEVVTSSLPSGLVDLAHEGYSISRFRVRRDSSGYVRGYFPYLSFDVPLFFRLLFRKRPDVYLIEPPPTSGAVMRVISWIKRRPYFYDAADIWSDAAVMSTNSKLVLSLLRKCEIFALGGARKIFTISSGVSQRLKELGVTNNIDIVGFGVDTTIFEYREVRSSEQPYFVYAGTYSEPHGASIFVRAFAQFALSNPSYKLVFVGNGTQRKELEELANSLGVVSVEFRETVSPHHLNTLLNGAVASLASLKPGTGYEYAFTTKIYASLAAGCPVLFSGTGPTHQFMADSTQRISAGQAVEFDEQQVFEAMILMDRHQLSDSDRRTLSDWSRQQFSIDVIASHIVATIHQEDS